MEMRDSVEVVISPLQNPYKANMTVMQLESLIGDIRHTTSQWYVVHCKYQKEAQAAAGLKERLSLSVYLPEVRRHERGQLRCAPFFPGYLFVCADLGIVALSQINTLPGVIRLISFDDLPQPVPAVAVEEIRRRIDELNISGYFAAHDFRPGDTLRLKRGPFQGFEAIFLGPATPRERVRVLIEFLGDLRTMEVDVAQLERDAAGAARPPRRTRGKGRTIRRDQIVHGDRSPTR
jgi:transcription antitermination factor NusG